MIAQGIAIAFFVSMALPIGVALVGGLQSFVTAWMVTTSAWCGVALVCLVLSLWDWSYDHPPHRLPRHDTGCRALRNLLGVTAHNNKRDQRCA